MSESKPLHCSDLVASCKQNIVSDMGGEKVMLSIRSGNYYNLGTIGGRIWDSLSRPIAIQALVEELTNEFSVGPAECETEVIAFLEQLRKEGLLLVNEEIASMARA